MRDSDERVYTLEVDGRPVLAFPARSFREAQSLLKEDWLLDDLRALQSHGAAVWDGKTKPVVRTAAATESETFAARSTGDTSDDLPIVYLIDLS
jgi:hypothetical protein